MRDTSNTSCLALQFDVPTQELEALQAEVQPVHTEESDADSLESSSCDILRIVPV